MRGYTEYVTNDTLRLGIITNCFGRVLYINRSWPDGYYERLTTGRLKLSRTTRDKCKKGREFTKAELLLELL